MTIPSRKERIALLKTQIAKKILVIDGAMGTAIQEKNLSAEDFGGPTWEGCNEYLCVTKPEVIRAIHASHLLAGCDIIETNSFGGTPLVLEEFELGKRAIEMNTAAATLARQSVTAFFTKEHPRFVAGSIGPTTKAISVTGGASFDEMKEHFFVQAKALFEADVDFFLLETCQDTRNVKAALLAMLDLFAEKKEEIPIAISVTIEASGTMLAGQTIESFLSSVMHQELLYLGLNCATGPEFMTDSIRSLAQFSPFPVACVPNAGLPDEHGCYLESPEMVSQVLTRFMDAGWLNFVGGCCGTTAKHIEALVLATKNKKPRVPSFAANQRSVLSGIEILEVTSENRPVLVGERTNVIGSQKFKKLICQEGFEEASEIAKKQIKAGAQIIDVCMANPDRDELSDMNRFLALLVKKIKAPIMIDSTDEKVIAASLKWIQGKAIINSINLEEGEERFEKVLPLVKKMGAAVVVGTIDDDPQQGMGIDRNRKLAIAKREYEILVNKYNISPQDLYWDVLVFPCATGDAQYVGSAVETIEGIRLVKKEFPETKTILGISNVSFGLPAQGREVLNSVFLYHCVQAGLDLAIVNTEKIVRFASIPEKEKELSEALLFNKGSDPITEFTQYFRSQKVQENKPSLFQQLPLEERLAQYIVEGSKEGLLTDLKLILKEKSPLDIINGPLMKGMDQVGKLFNANELIVAEVLQSAEVMKTAVNFLEQFMEKTETAKRGKVVLATVKGDVHDIGKNLVEIILQNNGFEVINLGIKIPPEQLIEAVKTHKPNMIGLSGLLVKSAQQMVITADDLTKAGVTPPLLVGGAALTENFVDKQISAAYAGTVAYAKDAMTGLELAKQIVDPSRFSELKEKLETRRKEAKQKEGGTDKAKPKFIPTVRSRTLSLVSPLPKPTDLERHVLRNTPIEQIWSHINPMMLYGRHLGIRGETVRKLEKATPAFWKELKEKEPSTIKILEAVEKIKKDFGKSPLMSPKAVFQFFCCGSRGNSLYLFSPFHSPPKVVEISFGRQAKEDGLSLPDYCLPIEFSGSLPDPSLLVDSVCLFVVSVGDGVREWAEQQKNAGEYLNSHIMQALALESAEGYAEFLHAKIRSFWGFSDPPTMTNMDRFQAKYRGKRYSFGYPACPKLEDQEILFDLLNPKEIGVQLTDGFMMDPEASVSAVVFHHPQASYFSIGT